MLGVRPTIAKEYIIDSIKAQLVPMLHGSPGIGKSGMIMDIANEWGLEVIDLRLSQCDPTDLLGFPNVSGQKATYRPMDTFPLETDELPLGKAGWLLFLDEFNSAPVSVQKAAYKLVLDRMVGQYKLHPKCAIVCAGNLDTDGALVNRMTTAIQSRLAHITLEVHTEDWLEWAQSNDIDYRITSYIQFRPSCLHKFDPDHSDMTFACPRTWEFVSRLIKGYDEIPSSKTNLLAGVVTEGVTHEFLNFTKIFNQLPDLNTIKSNPGNADVPREPSTLYAMSGVLADNTDASTVAPFLDYIERMPKEFQIITIKEMNRRYPAIQSNERFLKKVTEVATLL